MNSEVGSMIAVLFSVLMGYTFSIMGRTCFATGHLQHAPCSMLNMPICRQVRRATRTVQQKSQVLVWLRPWPLFSSLRPPSRAFVA